MAVYGRVLVADPGGEFWRWGYSCGGIQIGRRLCRHMVQNTPTRRDRAPRSKAWRIKLSTLT